MKHAYLSTKAYGAALRVNCFQKKVVMVTAEAETESVRTLHQRHETPVEETARLLERFLDPGRHVENDRRDTQHPRHSICAKIRVTPCNDFHSPIGSTEVAFTRNISVGGACVILPEMPTSDILRVEFVDRVFPYTLMLRLIWKRSAGKFTEAGGAFIGRL